MGLGETPEELPQEHVLEVPWERHGTALISMGEGKIQGKAEVVEAAFLPFSPPSESKINE